MHPLRQVFHARPRLFAGFAAGILAGLLLPGQYSAVTRSLFGWNVAVWLYLVLVWTLMLRADTRRVRELAEREDESAEVVLAIVCIAAVTSIAAIVVELAGARTLAGETRFLRYAFTALTVLGSWCLVSTMFALHYARMFYNAAPAPLRFPDELAEPNFVDFLYFSFTIAVAAQTSDIAVASRPMRAAVLAQSVLSFLFNAAILGLSINIAAGVVGG